MTWRKNTTQEEVEDLRRFVEDMKRGLTPVTGDSLVETLRQIHDRREAEPPRPDHRQLLLERLRRQMAERDGEECEPQPGCEVVFLPPRKPRVGLRWAIAASLVVHVAFAGAVLPNVRFNPLIVAKVLTPTGDDELYEKDVDWVPIAPVGGPAVVPGVDVRRAIEPNAGTQRPTAGLAGNPDSRFATTASAEPVAVRASARPSPGPSQPVAPALSDPLMNTFAPESLAERNLEDGPPDLDGPPESSSPQQSGVTSIDVLTTAIARDVDTQPRVLTRPRPVYTSDALEDNIQGIVHVSALFGADGTIRDVRILRGLGHGLDESAMKAVMQIRFIPATLNGVPVSVTRTIKIGFSLR
jgi:TonB family protein